MWELERKQSTEELMLLICGVGENSWESLGLQEIQPVHPKGNQSWICWSWNSNTLVTWWEELTHSKRSWCWERWKAGEGDDRGWDGLMASLTRWTEFEQASGVGDGQRSLESMGLQRVRHDWVTFTSLFTSHLPVSVMTASAKLFEASLDFEVESLLSLMEQHTVGIVL